jgi:mannose/fructose/N-acetylgalactosamine-specific phosphotransferase system component IIB
LAIALIRIDDRLIHGQITTKWIAHANANRIMIASDRIVQDKIRKSVVELTAPKSIKTEVVTLAEAIEKLTGPLAGENCKVFVICVSPDEVLALKQGGVAFNQVVIGNMGAMGSIEPATRVTKSVLLTGKDRKDFNELLELGVKCEIRVIPSDRPVDIVRLL